MFKKFSRYLLIGLSAFVLAVAAQQGLFNNQTIQQAQAISCNAGEPVNDCHTLWGTGHTYCVWNADGNTEGRCVVETCFNGGNPPDCGGSPNQEATNETVPCMTNLSLCGENTQYCENTAGQGSAMIFKHAGICDPSSGARDANGCVFQFSNVRSFTGSNCQDISAPAQAVTVSQPQTQQAAQPDCGTCGGNNQPACTGACRTTIGNCQNGFFLQSDGICRASQQQQVNECPRSDFENGHPQRCINGRFVQCFCDSQGCTWQHDNGACGGTTTPATPVPPAPTCRSITCPAAPAGCAFTGQLINTCNPAVTLTCGTLTCNQPTASGGVTNNNCTGNNSCSGGGATVTVTNTVTNPSPQVVLAASAAPLVFQNVGIGASIVSATALPKTGLPALAWSVLAFIPAGFKMKGFSQIKKALENHPNYIWENRQFRNG